jgi:hypothetical protein
MNGKRLWLTARILAVLVLAAGTGALAQAPLPEHLSGIISDYTPLISTLSPTGPWEMRGHWSLHLKGRSDKADFSAYMTMELSDSGVAAAGKNLADPASRSAHTHHIVMSDATVSSDPSETSSCPAVSPANTPKFVVNGTANFISGNGNSAPFEKLGATNLQVCISGGDGPTEEVQYSNMTLVMTGPAADKHFGPQAIHGVVRFPHNDDRDNHQRSQFLNGVGRFDCSPQLFCCMTHIHRDHWRTWMVNFGRRTIAGLQTSSQRLIAATMAEPIYLPD